MHLHAVCAGDIVPCRRGCSRSGKKEDHIPVRNQLSQGAMTVASQEFDRVGRHGPATGVICVNSLEMAYSKVINVTSFAGLLFGYEGQTRRPNFLHAKPIWGTAVIEPNESGWGVIKAMPLASIDLPLF
jgi:hypothetical protein